MSPLKFATIPFPVCGGIDFFTSKQLMDICHFSLSTLERYRNTLIDLRVPGFEYQFYSRGYSRRAAVCIWEYAQLVKQAGVVVAGENIYFHMIDYWRDND